MAALTAIKGKSDSTSSRSAEDFASLPPSNLLASLPASKSAGEDLWQRELTFAQREKVQLGLRLPKNRSLHRDPLP